MTPTRGLALIALALRAIVAASNGGQVHERLPTAGDDGRIIMTLVP